MKRYARWSIVAVAITIATASGCNTVEGAGKDMEAAGEAIQDAAN